MRCEKCGQEFPQNAGRCPNCNASAQYSGNTYFYKSVSNKTMGLKDIFSDVFRHHPKEAAAKMFIAGTPLSTPTPDRMLAEWQKPWLFLRVFGIGLLFCLVCVIITEILGQIAGLTTLMIGGLFVIPFTFLVFSWEMNIPRDIPFYNIIIAFVLGGVLSIFFALILFNFRVDSMTSASWAAFAEEPAKLLVTIVFIYLFKVRYGLGGILIGAAVGCGFSVFEDIMYVMRNGNSLEVFFIRVTAVGGHYLWAACSGGGAALALNGEGVSSKTLPNLFKNLYFWVGLGGSIVTHYLWNTFGYVTGMDILNPIAQFVIFIYILKPCLKQVVDEVNKRSFSPSSFLQGDVPHANTVVSGLYCSHGNYANTTFPLQYGTSVKIGRSVDVNQIILPADTVGVSREHCVLSCTDGKWSIVDISSTSTMLNNTVIEKNRPYYLNIGDTISIGTPAHTFTVV